MTTTTEASQEIAFKYSNIFNRIPTIKITGNTISIKGYTISKNEEEKLWVLSKELGHPAGELTNHPSLDVIIKALLYTIFEDELEKEF